MTARVVLDTSTLVSAIGWKESKPRQILDKCLNKEIILLVSYDCLNELEGVLLREKFDFIDKNMKKELICSLLEIAEIITPVTHKEICRDKKDNKFIELAIDGKADYIIASDDDLISLKKVEYIRIINPSDFLKIITE
ncbi:putative toxin-antitoxin system toxin component, PIN family [Candidatus Woesearchaeota archaeon]|nr:putative toxin-antitoxin system toxin component, PIN family [Candidatus Woesearchaeota archaeon]